MKNVINIDNPILAATEKYKKRPSIVKIIEKAKMQNQFCFKYVASIEMKRILKDTYTNKATQKDDLPASS